MGQKFVLTKLIDLTQTLKEGIPDWDGCCGFQFEEVLYEEVGISVQSVSMPLGIGTHMDAPKHMIKGAKDIASIELNKLIAPAIVMDVREVAHAEYFLTVNEIKIFENKYGDIPKGALFLLLTGWSQFWEDPSKYRNEDNDGHKNFPGFSEDTAHYLVDKGVVGIGLDTLSPDGSHPDFPVHKAILGADKYILENLCNLEQLPPVGAKVMAFPMKVGGGSESPVRIIAEV